MKILHICEGITPSTIIAQPWKHIVEIATRMAARGHEVKILTNKSSVSNLKEIKGIPLLTVQKRFFFDGDQLLDVLNRDNFDVINFHGSDPWSAIHLWRLRKKLNADVIWTLHSGPITFNDIKRLKLYEIIKLYKFWNNILNALFPSYLITKWASISQLKIIITLSEQLKEHLNNIGFNNNKIKIIRSGVDTRRFHPIPKSSIITVKKKIGVGEDDFIILYFGALSRYRGADTIISAMSNIVKQIPSARLLLLARGNLGTSEEKMLEKMANGMREIMLMPGILDQKTLVQYLSIADTIVLPFRFWPQVECPLTILESMSMEKPVITTNIGAIPEIVINGENAVLINPGDPELMAETVIKLLQNRDLFVKIGRNARAFVKRFYDWDVIVQQTLALY